MSTPGKTYRRTGRAIVVAHRHGRLDPLDMSLDVIRGRCNKTVKGGPGNFSITLAPRRNYLNELQPNDMVDIYLDPGDGQTGMTRIMLGYVDSIRRTRNVTDHRRGVVRMAYTINGTDFQKSVEQTDIIFKPQLAGRTDIVLDERFSAFNLGGHALRTRGVIPYGTPADILENMLMMLLGFGAQWLLPDSFPINRAARQSRRLLRRQRAVARVNESVRDDLKRMDIDVRAITDAEDLEARIGFIEDEFRELQESADKDERKHDDTAKRLSAVRRLLQRGDVQGLRSTLRDTGADAPDTILDLIDTSFIEAMAIDGYISQAAVWQGQGKLSSLIRRYSNEAVNEVFYDLRPVAQGRGDACFGDSESVGGFERLDYSVEPDEGGYNINGTRDLASKIAPSKPGIKYVPAVVMREYPHSTVAGLDLSKYRLFGTTEVGFVPFGPVFSQGVDEPGRHVYDYTADGFPTGISPQDYGTSSKPRKHLDVVVLEDDEITDEDVGRSDKDIFNFFSAYAESPIMKATKYMLNDLLPIVNQISIARSGLRVKEMTTPFAFYAVNRTKKQKATSSAVPTVLARWGLLQDHWFQHAHEYLSGTLTTGRIDVRPGYRADRPSLRESYYVEGVQWDFQAMPNGAIKMGSALSVTRGQRNDPFPAYIPPSVRQDAGAVTIKAAKPGVLAKREQRSAFGAGGGGNRTDTSRLAETFAVVDPLRPSEGDSLIDVPPKANRGGWAEYPQFPASVDEGTKKR